MIDLLSFHALLDALLTVLSLEIGRLLGAGFALQNQLAILVQLQLGDDHIRRMNSDVDSSTVGLLALDSLNVNNELASIALHDFAGLRALVVTTNNLNNK